MKKLRLIAHNLAPWYALTAGALLWEASVRALHTPAWLLPAPTRIVRALWEARALIGMHTVPTLIESLAGLVVAVFLGAFIASLIEWSPLVRHALYPLLVITQTVPTIALAPLFAVWFGFGALSKIMVISLVCFFPITVSLVGGFRGIDRDTLKAVRAMGATPWQLFTKVKIPASLPSFFSGLRIAASYSVLGAVVAEWFGAERGLGIFLVRAAKSYTVDRVFAIILVISALTLLLVWCVNRIARLTIPWHYRNQLST
jgi:ABC-type nitrate/sulfonate/bicarbonate transport system permease component